MSNNVFPLMSYIVALPLKFAGALYLVKQPSFPINVMLQPRNGALSDKYSFVQAPLKITNVLFV